MIKTLKQELAEIELKISKLENRREDIYRLSLAAPADEKVCDDVEAEMLGEVGSVKMRFPIEIHGITSAADRTYQRTRTTGKFVAVRPCDEHLNGRTFLGISLGDITMTVGASFHKNTGVLALKPVMLNPAIWVPDLERVVFGCESWWGVITKPEDLQKITDADINSIWYVRALKQLSGNHPESPDGCKKPGSA